MATPRKLLVDSEVPLCYHLVSRCVRQAWLCGQQDGHSYEHRKAWIEDRILSLGEAFSVDVLAYSVMSNHFHIVVHYDPGVHESWSHQEVIDRWLQVFPPGNGDIEAARLLLESDGERIEKLRHCLGSLSGFMKHLKQPIALRVNREDEVKGHLFEQRFYSGALLDEESVIAAMRYVDLNPFRARVARTLDGADHTSIQHRLRELRQSAERLDDYIGPLAAGPDTARTRARSQSAAPTIPRITLRDYIALLHDAMKCDSERATTPAQALRTQWWMTTVRLLRKRQRAYGRAEALTRWLAGKHMRCLEQALPGA